MLDSCKMRKIFILSFSFLILFSCKKETVEVEHSVQFQSNILTTAGTYSLTIDDAASDINGTYKLKENSNVHLMLFSDTSTTWITGSIFVDGKAIKYDEGYKDTIDLSYTIK